MIIETDIGHDPDDFFTICYLVSAGVEIDAILITPGDLDQLAICRFLCNELGLNIPIGASKVSTKFSSGSIHHALLKKYGQSLSGYADDFEIGVLPTTEVFVIGPPSNIGKFFAENPDKRIAKLTMQGGFLGYHLHPFASVRIPRFEGKTHFQTFNMNGDHKGTRAILAANIGERRFCGKNVCHTVIYDREKLINMSKPKDRASELFIEGMEILLERHDGKKFHDPVAAVCHLHPEVGTWIKGKIDRNKDGWGTTLDEDGDWILADINYDKFWEHIYNWS